MFVYIYTVTILKHFKHLTTHSWTGAWMQYGGTKHTADLGRSLYTNADMY